MREMKVATNEVVVFTNSTVVRAMGGPELTVRQIRRPACEVCHIVPGSAEPMVVEGNGLYHAHCLTKVRRFRSGARKVARVMTNNGITDPVARKEILRAAVEAAKHVHS